MRKFLTAAVVFFALAPAAMAQAPIGDLNTNRRIVSPDEKVLIERNDDPKVDNVACYMSRTQTGGVGGWAGIVGDPSKFSLACRAVGPVTIPSGIAKNETIYFASASPFFQSFKIIRLVDDQIKVLAYTVVSEELINGTHGISITALPATAK